MPRCFVIQPFDDDVFDRRYRETFAPAVSDAGLEPYRVDEDPSVEVPIDEIRRNIQHASICFAEISTNNPNVWYELGYADACRKRVIMVCSDERKGRYPFDIHHRSVIRYETGSGGDFDKLRTEVSKRACAFLKLSEKDRVAIQAAATEKGLELEDTHVEFLRIAANELSVPGDSTSANHLKKVMHQCGIGGIDYGLSLRKLEDIGFVERREEEGSYHEDYEMYYVVELTEMCWNWIKDNRPLFRERKSSWLDDVPF